MPAQNETSGAVSVSPLTWASRALVGKCCFDQRHLAAAYFTLAFATRLFLRSRYAADLSWVTVMLMQDGMSIVSFLVGLTYLHHSNGGFAMALLSKCVSPPARAEEEGPSALEEEASDGNRRTAMRLFYFAM